MRIAGSGGGAGRPPRHESETDRGQPAGMQDQVQGAPVVHLGPVRGIAAVASTAAADAGAGEKAAPPVVHLGPVPGLAGSRPAPGASEAGERGAPRVHLGPVPGIGVAGQTPAVASGGAVEGGPPVVHFGPVPSLPAGSPQLSQRATASSADEGSAT